MLQTAYHLLSRGDTESGLFLSVSGDDYIFIEIDGNSVDFAQHGK